MKKLPSFWRFLFALAVPLLLSGCMETAQTNKPVVAEQSTSASGLASGKTAMADATQMNTIGASGSALTSADMATGDYRIGSRDVLQVSVFQVQDLNNTVQVGQDGNVTLALVGKIQLRGRTTYEAEQIIASKLREKYLQSPQVSVSI